MRKERHVLWLGIIMGFLFSTLWFLLALKHVANENAHLRDENLQLIGENRYVTKAINEGFQFECLMPTNETDQFALCQKTLDREFARSFG